MKKKLYYIMILLAGAVLGSCSGNQKLAEEIAGSWAGTPEKFTDTQAFSATIIENYTFTRDKADDDKHPGGPLNITGMISAMSQVAPTGGLVQPITLSASATVTVAGTWSVIDDDEVAVVMDTKSLQVNVDPQAVVVTENVLSDQGTPEMATLKQQISQNIAARLRQEMSTRFGALRHLDDVEIKGDMLKFEIGKTDYTLARQVAR